MPFEADDGTVPFEKFVSGLSDFKFMALGAAIDSVLSARGLELVRTEWVEALGGGLHEVRIFKGDDVLVRAVYLIPSS